VPWMPGIPHDPTATYGGLAPIALVDHRTYGGWGGDYSVGKGARGKIGFQFLVGKEFGQWVQFADTSRLCYHAAGANSWSAGIEVTGVNEDEFTDWQDHSMGWRHAWNPSRIRRLRPCWCSSWQHRSQRNCWQHSHGSLGSELGSCRSRHQRRGREQDRDGCPATDSDASRPAR